MFRVVTLNLNGIRAAAAKGFEAWAAGEAADCMGVQEVKAQADTVAGRFEVVAGMQGHFHYADARGYSGVGLYTRRPPSSVVTGIGDAAFDAEGRYVELRFDDPARPHLPHFSVISCYFPSGSSGDIRQEAKYRFLALMAPHLAALTREREYILVGDINIAHHEIDLKNWRGNRKNSGFLPDERAWLTALFDRTTGKPPGAGLVDVFRQLNPHPEQYTWWSNRGQARAKNVGWRIDYHLATPRLAALAIQGHIFLDQRFSDHAPLTIDYDFEL